MRNSGPADSFLRPFPADPLLQEAGREAALPQFAHCRASQNFHAGRQLVRLLCQVRLLPLNVSYACAGILLSSKHVHRLMFLDCVTAKYVIVIKFFFHQQALLLTPARADSSVGEEDLRRRQAGRERG